MMIKKTITKISNALAWLGGANIAILDRAPTSRGKFVQMGLVLLTTAGVAGVSMSFFMNHEVGEPENIAVIVGIFWGLIIFNLDRFLVVSMGATRDKRRLLLMATPRLLLAIVISLVVSTPITLRIFQSDIDYQLRVSQSSQSAYLSQQEAKGGLAAQEKTLQAKISQDKAIQDGALPQAVTNPQLQTAQQQVAQLKPQVAQAKAAEIAAYEAWQCELYGDGAHCANASNRPGQGPIANAKEQTYEQALNTYDSLNGQLQTAEGNVSAAEKSLKSAQGAALARYQQAADKELPGLESQLSTIERQIRQAKQADQTAINQHTGTLAQLSALWSASAGNATLLLAHLTVMALFFLIELLPVLVKFLLNLGPLDAYEKVFNSAEEEVSNQLRKERLVLRRQADADAQAQITVAEDKSIREQALGIRANAYVATRMETILDAALQQWSAQVTATLNQVPFTAGGTQQGGQGGQGGQKASGGQGSQGGQGGQKASGGQGSQGSGVSPNGAQTPNTGFGLPQAGGLL
jgi:uncharacterized membrane protein YgcG